MHKLLGRQLARYLPEGIERASPEALRAFLAKVDEAYSQSDEDRLLLERSLELTSQDLLTRHALLAATLDATAEGVLVVDASGRISSWNERFIEIWGLPQEILRRRDESALDFAIARLREPERFAANMRAIDAQAGIAAEGVTEFLDGRHIEWTSRPHVVSGKQVGRVWSFRDVTSRVRATDALRESEARLRALMENISDVVIVIDEAAVLRYASPSVERTLGFAPEDLVSASLQRIIHPDDHTLCGEKMQRLLAGVESPCTSSVRMIAKDGSVREIETVAVDARGRGGVGGIVTVARDVTERKRIEREAESQRDALQRNERLSALGTLVAGVAHEINNPLTFIIPSIEFAIEDLEKSGAPAEMRRGLSLALEGTLQIARITRALKVVARQGREPRARVDVRDLVQGVVALARAGAPSNVTLVAEGAGAAQAWGSVGELHQVVLNLAKNGVEAIGDKHGNVRVRYAARGGQVEIVVEDDGPGIPADILPHIFDPFFTTKVSGTGLGLSIIHSIVEQHGGSTRVETAPGRGTRFTLLLPTTGDAP